jgi:hypothetical protein
MAEARHQSDSRLPADDLPSAVLAAFPPSSDALLICLCELVTDDMLEEISAADYGMNAAENLVALKEIRDLARIPCSLDLVPLEVLELVRWSTPGSHRAQGTVDRRGHLMRAFCCAVLLRAAVDPENRGKTFTASENQTIAALVDSAVILQRPVLHAAAGFITWRIEGMKETDELRPFFAFGLLALAALAEPEIFPVAEIAALAAFVERTEMSLRDPTGSCTLDMLPGSFLSLTDFTAKHALWRALAATIESRFSHSKRICDLARRVKART